MSELGIIQGFTIIFKVLTFLIFACVYGFISIFFDWTANQYWAFGVATYCIWSVVTHFLFRVKQTHG